MTERPAEPPDEELLARSVSGDRSAFALLASRHEATVQRTAGGLLAWSSDVPDAVQDVWMTAWRRRGSFKGKSTVKTWLTGIAIYVCRNRLRSHWRRPTLDVAPEETTQPQDHLVVDEVHQEVRRAVARLHDTVREVAVLYYIEEMTSSEVAAHLGIAVNTVDKRLQRAREQLRVLLKSVQSES